MLPYRVQYNEFEYDIKNYNLLHKIAKNAKILSICWIIGEFFQTKNRKLKNVQKLHFLFCIMYKFHNSYFVIFVICVNFVMLGFSYLYIHVPLSYCRTVVYNQHLHEHFCEHHYKRLYEHLGALAQASRALERGPCALKMFVKVFVKVFVKMFVKGIHKG